MWIAPPDALAPVAQRLARVLAPPVAPYQPFVAEGQIVGWITPDRAHGLARWPSVFAYSPAGIELSPRLDTPSSRSAALSEVALVLAAEGALTAWRDECYAVSADATEPPLFELERAAARYFGIHTRAAHANGLVAEAGGWRMWLARRSPTKAIDPGLLDNLVGGGIASGATPAATLTKEAWEEAGIARPLAQRARCEGTLDIRRDQPDGLQRETIHVHDLWLPAAFEPANQDGEAVEHRLCRPEQVLSVLATDAITGEASLVIVDFLLRQGHVAADDPSLEALQALRDAPTPWRACAGGGDA